MESNPDDPVPECSSPSRRAWPDQNLEFEREITSDDDPAGTLPDAIDVLSESVQVRVRASILASFFQRWALREVMIGDYATLLSLAPSEVLTIETRRTQHTLLEQSQENASTVETGTENLDSDKESITVANTSSRTANWGVSGTGSFSLYGVGASASVTDNHTVNDTTSSTINSIHENTLKSSQKVTTQTKLQIRGVTEATVEARQTRILRNPYPDRVLDLNLYELVKRFNVTTAQNTLQLMITATVEPLVFTQSFVSGNGVFLQTALLDDQLASVLSTIISALQQAPSPDVQRAVDSAVDTLEQYLFEDRPGVQPYHTGNDYLNDTPTNAFTNKDVYNPGQFSNINYGASGTAISLNMSAGFEIYAELQLYWMMMGGYPSGTALPTWPAYRAQRLALMRGLAAKIRDAWENKLDDGGRRNLMSSANRTEVFRRVPGFLAAYDELLGTLTVPQPDGGTVALVNALVNHLNRAADYYTEQFLRYAWDRMGNAFVMRFTNDVLASLFPPPTGYIADFSRPFLNLYQVEDVHRRGLSVLVPINLAAVPARSSIPGFAAGLTQLDDAIAQSTPAGSRADEVTVPTEGIHVEPVAGACVLCLPTSTGSAVSADA